MNWHIDTNGGTAARAPATDADEDMAFALMMADKQWGGYASDASSLVSARSSPARCRASNILLPDDSGNMNTDINPSYFAPAYYKLFPDLQQPLVHGRRSELREAQRVRERDDRPRPRLVQRRTAAPSSRGSRY